MERQFIYFFVVILIINVMGFKASSISNEDLSKENQFLKEYISQFETIDSSKSNTAIELNKLNVVYRGVSNPMTISVPNVVNFEASAPGLRKIDDYGHYELSPGSGLKVDVLIKGILENGDTITETKTFRIKDIGKPIGTINRLGYGSDCPLELTKAQLIDSEIGIKIQDFLNELDYDLKDFKIKKNNQKSIKVGGHVFNEEANDLIRRSKRNDEIYIFDIRLNNPANVCIPSIASIRIKIVD